MNDETAKLIHEHALKEAAAKYRTEFENRGEAIPGIFDKWFLSVHDRLLSFNPHETWEQSIVLETARLPQQKARGLEWDFLRFRLFLDRWMQGRFVDYEQRRKSGVHYVPKYGTEFGSDVLLTCQGTSTFMQWRDLPLMKTVFDFALYPQILDEIRPHTIFEIGSGSGASALWFADHMAMLDIGGQVHSVDINPVQKTAPNVTFHQGDCREPASLFAIDVLKTAPRPWLVIEDAHHNVEAVLEYFHAFLKKGDYLYVEDSEIKHDDIQRFLMRHPGCYLVDTKFTDFFGRNATCALDSIFMRVS